MTNINSLVENNMICTGAYFRENNMINNYEDEYFIGYHY